MSFAQTFASPGVGSHRPPCSSLHLAAGQRPEAPAGELHQPQAAGASPLVDGVCVGLLLAGLRRLPRRRGQAPGRGSRAAPDAEGASLRLWAFQRLLRSVRRRIGLKSKTPQPQLVAAGQEGQQTEIDAAGDEAGGPPSQSSKANKQGALFNSEEMKRKVREGLIEKTYHVADFYKKSGLAQRIARHPAFENFTLAVIALNAVWIGVDTDLNKADVLLDSDPIFQIADNAFCAYFSFEWLVRLMSFKRKRDCLKDRWFTFDSSLLIMMVLDTWVMTAVLWATGSGGEWVGVFNASFLRIRRLVRLFRMTRMVRLLRSMPELLILVKGMVAGIRSVFFTFCLLLVMLYIFGITFRQIAGGNAVLSSLYFSSVPTSMYNLLIHGTLLDSFSRVVLGIGAQSRFVVSIFWVFVVISALTLMNMLIGVLCEVVSAVSATEKEAILVSFVKEKMQELFLELDESGDGLIERDEFLMILENRQACQILHDVGVDVVGLVDQIDIIFADETCIEGETEKTLDLPELVELVLSLRGSCSATVKDIIDLRKFVRTTVGGTNKSLARVSTQFDSLVARRRARRTRARSSAAEPAAAQVVPLEAARSDTSGRSTSSGSDTFGRSTSSGSAPAVGRPTRAAAQGESNVGSQGDLAILAEGLESRLRSRTEGLRTLVGELEAELSEVRLLRARSEALSSAAAAEAEEAPAGVTA